ncbi:MAG: hypothetical protein RQ899_09790 [Pseudomonadales bacterium]|nr:hypothetical protein [Pseudomonadales bacterium]
MVMLGVFLALLLDEWRQDRQRNEIAQLTQARIVSEINSNYEAIVNYETRLNSRYESFIEWGQSLDPTKSIAEQFDDFPGFPGIFLNDAAWRRSSSSEITNYIDDSFITSVYGLYDFNLALRATTEMFSDIYFSKDIWDNEFTLASYNMMDWVFKETFSQAKQAKRIYSNFIESYPVDDNVN